MKKNFFVLLILLSTNALHATENEEMNGKTPSKQKSVSFSQDFLSFDELLNERNTLKSELQKTKNELKKVSQERTQLILEKHEKDREISERIKLSKLVWHELDKTKEEIQKGSQGKKELSKDLSSSKWLCNQLWECCMRTAQQLKVQKQQMDELAFQNFEMRREINERIAMSQLVWQELSKVQKEKEDLLEICKGFTKILQQQKGNV